MDVQESEIKFLGPEQTKRKQLEQNQTKESKNKKMNSKSNDKTSENFDLETSTVLQYLRHNYNLYLLSPSMEGSNQTYWAKGPRFLGLIRRTIQFGPNKALFFKMVTVYIWFQN